MAFGRFEYLALHQDQGDRSLIFYFERGRDSGVKATSVFFVWLGHVDQGHVNRLKILPHLIYNSIGQSADTNHLTWTCSKFTHHVTDYIFLSILSVELEFWNNLLLSLPILPLRDSDGYSEKVVRRRTTRFDDCYRKLPDEFKTQQMMDSFQCSQPTASRNITRFLQDGIIERIAHGTYRKILQELP